MTPILLNPEYNGYNQRASTLSSWRQHFPISPNLFFASFVFCCHILLPLFPPHRVLTAFFVISTSSWTIFFIYALSPYMTSIPLHLNAIFILVIFKYIYVFSLILRLLFNVSTCFNITYFSSNMVRLFWFLIFTYTEFIICSLP